MDLEKNLNLKNLDLDQLESYLEGFLTSERVEKIHQVVNKRLPSFVSVFEDIYDEGNMSACMRSAEAFGFYKFYVLNQNGKKKANRVARGSDKWLDISHFSETRDLVDDLKKKKFQIVVTDLLATKSIEEVDFQKPTALVFGNEHKGTSEEIKGLADEKVIIPMNGFCQSFNISVAAAVSFHHVYLAQRKTESSLSEDEKRELRIKYYLRSLPAKFLAKTPFGIKGELKK